MTYESIKNWAGAGKFLVTKEKVPIEKGDNYISEGFLGKTIFTHKSDFVKKAQKVVARSHLFTWKRPGNQTIEKLPHFDFE